MPREISAKAKMVRSAVSLIRRRGLSAASFAEIVSDSGAPRGSIYHHFPQGKDQLAKEAIQATSNWMLENLRACTATTPIGVLECFIEMWRGVVVASNATAGCAIAGVAVDTLPDATDLMAAVRSAFDACVDALSARLRDTGLPATRSRALAVTALAAMEGALILCRADRSVEPLTTVAGQLKRLARGE